MAGICQFLFQEDANWYEGFFVEENVYMAEADGTDSCWCRQYSARLYALVSYQL
jgi:hypothetical protein